MSPIAAFAREARRRRSFRTAGLYIVGAWLVMQAADVFFPAWGLPDAALNVLLVAAIFGFPLALVFGWFYDVTARGIVRTPGANEESGDAPLSLQRSDYVILSALVVMAAVIVYDAITDILETPRVAFEEVGQSPDDVLLQKLPNSVAVLPFANVSNDPDNEAFCDGISEEILHKLSQFTDLRVIGRTSSFAFKGSDYRIPRIAALLGARFLLQGSVRQYGNQLRISAQLVDDTGVQQWSGAFDRTLEDVFAIQTEIADVVATTVVPRISPQHDAQSNPDLAAYQHYLAGRALLHRREEGAKDELSKAVDLDPTFAEAHAEYAIAILIGQPSQSVIEAADQAIETALRLKPGLPRALAARGLLLTQQYQPDYPAAETVLREALERAPNMVDAMNWLANALNSQERDDEAFAIHKRALTIDPLHGAIGVNVATNYRKRGEADRAEAILLRLVNLPKPVRYAYMSLRDMYADQGRLVDMNRIEKRHALTGLHVYWGLVWNYAMLGDSELANYWAYRSRRDFPDRHGTLTFPSAVLYNLGQNAEALEKLQQVVSSSGLSLSEIGQWISPYYAELQALTGDFDGAAATLEPVLPAAEEVHPFDYDSIGGLLTLAWAYAEIGSADADGILRFIENRHQNLQARGIAHGSREPLVLSRVAILRGEHDLALDRLEEAIDAGWRAYYKQRFDPRWAPLSDDPRYQALMARVKADVDRQRAEVERLDAKEDFIAMLDEARAARQ